MSFPDTIDVVGPQRVHSPGMSVFLSFNDLRCEAPFVFRPRVLDQSGSNGISMRQGRAPQAVIQVSNDEHLARSRSLLLQSVGFRVRTYSNSQAESMIVPENAFAIFLCQTVAVEKAVSFLEAIRSAKSEVPLIRATYSPAQEMGIFDRVLHAPVMPQKLTREMLGLKGEARWKEEGR